MHQQNNKELMAITASDDEAQGEMFENHDDSDEDDGDDTRDIEQGEQQKETERIDLMQRELNIMNEKLGQKDAIVKDLEDSLAMAKSAERQKQETAGNSSEKKLATIISKCTLLEQSKVPEEQRALVLHAIRERFVLSRKHPTPSLRKPDELLVRIQAIGLNPIDWKSVDYGFGIPWLPYIA